MHCGRQSSKSSGVSSARRTRSLSRRWISASVGLIEFDQVGFDTKRSMSGGGTGAPAIEGTADMQQL